MDKRFDKLLADRPAALELIRAYLYLQAVIGHPELGEVQNDLKLAAMHLEDAMDTMRTRATVAELPNE